MPAYLPFSIYRPWTGGGATPQCRAAARARLGMQPGEVAIATFGFVHASKAPQESSWRWRCCAAGAFTASLHFVGAFEGDGVRAGLAAR